MALQACSRLRIVQWANHRVKMDDSRSKKKKGICTGRRRHEGNPRSRWEDAVWRDAVDLLHVHTWKVAAKKREFWRKEIGEAMARKKAEAPYKEKKP